MLKILLFFFIINTSLLAYEVQGYFEPENGNEQQLLEGDIFDGILRLWPFPNAEVEEFKKREGDTFLHFFTLVEVKGFNYSENNSEVLEVRGTFVLTKAFQQKDFFLWEYRDLNIPIEIRNIVPKNFQIKDQKLVVYSQDDGKMLLPTWTWIVIILLIAFSIYYIRNFYLNKKNEAHKKQLAEKEKKYWLEEIESANDRKAYEYLYAERSKWSEWYLSHKDVKGFFELMESHQYKKDWTEEEINEVSSAFFKVKELVKE